MQKLRTSIFLATIHVFSCNALGQKIDQDRLTGREILSFETQQSGLSEVCVLPSRSVSGEYSYLDDEIEKSLCSIDFRFDPQIAICPKISSTNPGVEIYHLDSPQAKYDFESSQCEVRSKERTKEKTTKVAKFKQSISCSYTPSILGYYHVSRLLGGIGNVPPAVLRTMDRSLHRDLALAGYQTARRNLVETDYRNSDYDQHKEEILKKTWGTYLWLHDNFNKRESETSKKYSPLLLTRDNEQIYGALQWNIPDDKNYKELYISDSDDWRAYQSYPSNPLISKIFLPDLIPYSIELSELIRLKDVSEMLVLDYLLSQQDRFRNIKYLPFVYFVDENGALGKEVAHDKTKVENEVREKGLFPHYVPKVMVLTDNDCGVSKGNYTKRSNILDHLNHFSRETYHRVQQLNSNFKRVEFKNSFQSISQFTENDLDGFQRRLRELSKEIKRRCQSGELKLDLNPVRLIRSESLISDSDEC